MRTYTIKTEGQNAEYISALLDRLGYIFLEQEDGSELILDQDAGVVGTLTYNENKTPYQEVNSLTIL